MDNLYEPTQQDHIEAVIAAIDAAMLEGAGDNVLSIRFPDGRGLQFHSYEAAENMRATYVNRLNTLRAEKGGGDWLLGRSIIHRP